MTTVRRCLSFAGFALIFCTANTWAQSTILKGDIPFAFHVGGQHFTPGTYEIRTGTPFPNAFTLRLLEQNDHQIVRLFFEDRLQSPAAPQSQLIFNRYGQDEYFLSQVWSSLHPNTMMLPHSKHEVVTSTLVTATAPEKVVIRAAARLH